MTSPGFLAVGGVEVANNARTLAYLQAGLGGPHFEAVTGSPCPDLLAEAFGEATCATGNVPDQFYASPFSAWRGATTGTAVTVATWREAGYVDPTGMFGGAGSTISVADPLVVTATAQLWIDLLQPPAASRQIYLLRPVAGTLALGNAALRALGPLLTVTAGALFLGVFRVQNNGSSNTSPVTITVNAPQAGQVCLRVAWTALGFTASLYGGDPDLGAPLMGTYVYGYSSRTDSLDSWAGMGGALPGVSEVASMSAATAIVLGASEVAAGGDFVFTELDVWASPCTIDPTTGTLFPADTLVPSDSLYPGQYGVFLDPAMDNAPWVDTDRPESYGYLGLLIDKIDGLDSTSTRTMDASADGVGGILGPETLQARSVVVSGWLIANGCSAMEYARRWFGDVLAGSLCANCDASYIDVRTTCGDDPAGDFYTNRWRLYDVGMQEIVTDLSGGDVCCYYTPISFKLGAADPFLYGPVLPAVPATLLNPGGADAPPVPFESWLFAPGTQVCTTVTDQGIGADAPIFTMYGGTGGIEAAVAFQSMGLYPSDSIWPDDCVIPGDGTTQQTNDACPFAFSVEIGPGELFVVDNARRRVVWSLADGSTLDGSPKLILNAGDAIEWIDTCAGTSIDACAVAYAACSCDDTAFVQIETQHRER